MQRHDDNRGRFPTVRLDGCFWLARPLNQLRLLPLSQDTVMLLIIVIILLLIWTPGYHVYGRRRWGLGHGGHLLTLLLVILVLWLLFARG